MTHRERLVDLRTRARDLEKRIGQATSDRQDRNPYRQGLLNNAAVYVHHALQDLEIVLDHEED